MSCFHFQTEPLFLKFLNLLNVGLSHLYIEIQNNNRNAASCIHNKNVHFEVGSFLVLAFSVSTKIDPEPIDINGVLLHLGLNSTQLVVSIINQQQIN